MKFERHFVNNADGLSTSSAVRLTSAVRPMYDRPQVVGGPFAPIKPKKWQKGLDDFPPNDSEIGRKAEYDDLKSRPEAVYRLKIDEINRKGQ